MRIKAAFFPLLVLVWPPQSTLRNSACTTRRHTAQKQTKPGMYRIFTVYCLGMDLTDCPPACPNPNLLLLTSAAGRDWRTVHGTAWGQANMPALLLLFRYSPCRGRAHRASKHGCSQRKPGLSAGPSVGSDSSTDRPGDHLQGSSTDQQRCSSEHVTGIVYRSCQKLFCLQNKPSLAVDLYLKIKTTQCSSVASAVLAATREQLWTISAVLIKPNPVPVAAFPLITARCSKWSYDKTRMFCAGNWTK